MSSEGSRHQPFPAPSGSTLVSFPISSKAQLPVFWTEQPNNQYAKHALVVVHGSLRDGDSYWTALNEVKQQQIQLGNSAVDKNTIITAPMFYSTRFNSGIYTATQLSWGDLNLWQVGTPSNHPTGQKVSSFTAVQLLIEHFDNRTMYPNLKNLTLIGHSGGAQFVSRYASVVPYTPKHTHVRYVVADPSSSAYFTDDRPVTDPNYYNLSTCETLKDWRYGFQNFNLPPYSGKSASEYFETYVTRDVVNLNGLLDTELNGDQLCMALAQGGQQRISRNLAWWKYLNRLARTGQDVSLFPGNFTNVPNWGEKLKKSHFNVKLSIVPNATHDVTEVFSSSEGLSAVYDDKDLVIGWRPTEQVTFPLINGTTSSNASSSNASPNSSFASAADRPALKIYAFQLAVSCALLLSVLFASL
ncbi:hypothetical protein MYAM1_001105 [Malassezia yamatoensis]|uniref:Uncharacterized protein n=1 Tax=Malassezia yamatoensis TaxID=253288 RepID=A0AAJ5YSB3_9BASI|nr:hypothetical protein MYAM1_001105 [Malassezia yamatoensis]